MTLIKMIDIQLLNASMNGNKGTKDTQPPQNEYLYNVDQNNQKTNDDECE